MLRQTSLAQRSRRAMEIVAVAVIAFRCLPLAAQNTTITGVVKNAAGESVAGALVKVSSKESGLGFMVVSQAQGRYSTPNLLPGKYAVQSFGGSFQSAPEGPVGVSSGQQGKRDLVLNVPLRIPPREKPLTDADYEKFMPESEDGIHTDLASVCNECHTLERILSARKTPEKWRETLDRMQDMVIQRRRALSFLYRSDREREDVSTMKYFSKFFTPENPPDPRVVQQWLLRPGGPSHPNRNLPPMLLEGAAAKYVTMEFSLPIGSGPSAVAVDSQGIAWISEAEGGMLGRFDPHSLTYTRIAPPPGKHPQSQLNAVAVDPRDQVWFVDAGPNARILQYDPKSREFNSYVIPEYRWPVPDEGWASIAALRFLDGKVWATGKTTDRILKLDPATRKVSPYAVPRGSVPFGMAISADQMVWYAAEVANAIVRFDPNDGVLKMHDVPTPRSSLRGMAADAEGGVWVAATDAGKLVKVDRAGKVTEYTLLPKTPAPLQLTWT